MKFEWIVLKNHPLTIKAFLKEKGISRRLLTKIKQLDHAIYLNDLPVTVRARLNEGDKVTVFLPREDKQDNIVPSELPIDIIYEDEYFLVVNKPAGIASIPSFQHPSYSMANRVKGYYKKQGYVNEKIHVVTRLDRDTSGVMLFAKHQMAHAMMDQLLRQKQVDKYYLAMTENTLDDVEHGFIDAPIDRVADSLMERQVVASGFGKEALTEFWLEHRLSNCCIYKVKLHTGRTHQIRVHFSYRHAALIGDDLYGGTMAYTLKRQALHCFLLSFQHPFTQRKMVFRANLPEDLKEFLKERGFDDGGY